MQAGREQDVTRLLAELSAGRPAAAEELFPAVYDALRALAGACFRNQPADHTLQPTALVHEAYVKLVGSRALPPLDRAHFLALAARVMRQVLVDHARGKRRDKRGGERRQVTLAAAELVAERPALDLLALDEALEKLAELNPQHARLVELRFFGGLGEQEAADVLGISRTSAARSWRFARAWLIDALWTEPGP